MFTVKARRKGASYFSSYTSERRRVTLPRKKVVYVCIRKKTLTLTIPVYYKFPFPKYRESGDTKVYLRGCVCI